MATIVALRYMEELDISLELSISITTSIIIINEFFELFWETYENSLNKD